MNDYEPVLRVTVRRALANDDPSRLPLHFEPDVLSRYRGAPGFSLIRSDTVGRLKKEGGWTLEIGIAPDDGFLQVIAGDLLRLPADEREHWASFATTLPSSRTFLQMRLAPGSCIDDGEIRKWE